jgi:NADP-dependent alcohol dehydrogenase
MDNFTFHNPTRIHFGRGQIAQLAQEIPGDARVLLLAGGGSIKANGVLAQVQQALGTRLVREFWGVEANPDFDTLMRAVELARREKLDWVLPVGGGSVLDGAKFVAAAVPFAGDPWDFVLKRGAGLRSALPIAAVLTLPATGSEANCFSVISRRTLKEKLAFGHPSVFPRCSILDPETTMSLPPQQTANGVGDAFCHVLEQYLTYPVDAAVQDRFAEGVLRTLVEVGPKTLANPRDYATRANFVWAATCALNGWISPGVPQDWSTHTIGHELTALHGIDHARTLAVVLPSLLQAQRSQKRAKLLQYADRVWDLRDGPEEARIDGAIARTRAFYESLGIRTRLSDYQVDAATTAPEVARRLAARGETAFGERRDLTPAKVEAILRAAA